MQRRIAYRLSDMLFKELVAGMSDKARVVENVQSVIKEVVVDMQKCIEQDSIWVFCVHGYVDADERKHIILPSLYEVHDAIADYACLLGICQTEAYEAFIYDGLSAEDVCKLHEICKENSKEVC